VGRRVRPILVQEDDTGASPLMAYEARPKERACEEKNPAVLSCFSPGEGGIPLKQQGLNGDLPKFVINEAAWDPKTLREERHVVRRGGQSEQKARDHVSGEREKKKSITGRRRTSSA